MNDMNVYNSHGRWSSLQRVYDKEVTERGNIFIAPPFPPETPAIWVTLTPEEAHKYNIDAGNWDVWARQCRLAPDQSRRHSLERVFTIELMGSMILCNSDGCGGFLLLSPEEMQ